MVHSCSWLLGRRPEFVDPRFVAQGEGRESEWCKPLDSVYTHHLSSVVFNVCGCMCVVVMAEFSFTAE